MHVSRFLPKALGLIALLAAALPLSAQLTWSQNSVVAATAANYDITAYGGTTYVAYESSGNIYVTYKANSATTWAAPEILAEGSAPSIAIGADGLNVGFIGSSGVIVGTAASPGSGWNYTTFGDINGTQWLRLRTDNTGTMYLLSQGSGNAGRGSIDIATNTGAGWIAPVNLAYGWYDSGSGNYYHQAQLAASTSAAGYRLAYEADNWGGRADWSSSSFTTSGFSPDTGVGFPGYQNGGVLFQNSLSVGASGAIFGYSMSGTGYVRTFNGTTWGSDVSLGSISSLAVDATNMYANTFVVYSQGGNLMQYNGTTNEAVSYSLAALAGTAPVLFGDGMVEHLLYLDGSGQLMYAQAVPEPATWAALAGLAALGVVLARRLRG